MEPGDPGQGWIVIAVLVVYGSAIGYTLYQWIRLLLLRRRLKRADPPAVAALKPAFRILAIRAFVIMITLQATAALLRD